MGNKREYILSPNLLLVVGLLLTFVGPFVLTRPALWEWCDFSGKGEIGDTIGGITAPFVNLLGAILVFYSFKEQIKANGYLQKDIERNNVLKLYEQIEGLIEKVINDVEKLNFNGASGYKAIDAFVATKMNLNNTLLNEGRLFQKDICYVLETLDFASRQIYLFKSDEKSFKNFLRIKFIHFYKLKIEDQINAIKKINEIESRYKLLKDKVEESPLLDNSVQTTIAFKILNIENTIVPNSPFWEN